MEETKLTREELQELTVLREEKRVREQTARAAETLKAAGIPQDFAKILTGADNTDTDARVKIFCETYQQTLSQDIRKRLPLNAPPVLRASTPTRPKRGIVRVR